MPVSPSAWLTSSTDSVAASSLRIVPRPCPSAMVGAGGVRQVDREALVRLHHRVAHDRHGDGLYRRARREVQRARGGHVVAVCQRGRAVVRGEIDRYSQARRAGQVHRKQGSGRSPAIPFEDRNIIDENQGVDRCGERDGSRFAVQHAVVDDELDNVDAGQVGNEARPDRRRVVKRRRAAVRHRGEATRRRSGGRGRHRRSRCRRAWPFRPPRPILIGARIGDRRRIVGGDDDAVGRAVDRAVVDDQLDHVGPEQIHDEGGIRPPSGRPAPPRCRLARW